METSALGSSKFLSAGPTRVSRCSYLRSISDLEEPGASIEDCLQRKPEEPDHRRQFLPMGASAIFAGSLQSRSR